MNFKLLIILGILRKGFILNMDTIVLDFLEGHVEVENFLDFISQEINSNEMTFERYDSLDPSIFTKKLKITLNKSQSLQHGFNS